jgi:cytochrome c553
MQRNNVILASLTLAALLGATNTVQAADDNAQEIQAENADMHGIHVNLANGEKIFKEGKGEVPACQSCHGPDAMGDDNMGTPRLAGQGMVYLVKELEDFAHGRRKDMTMFVMDTAVAPKLSPEDRADVAGYVSTKLSINYKELSNVKDLTAAGQKVGSTYLGKAIVLYGIPEKDVPACQSCHQYNGRGAAPIFPQIGLQKYVYLTNQLKHWRDGTRANDPTLMETTDQNGPHAQLGIMREVAKKMSDEDIANVASYLMTAPRTTMGNSFTPESHIPVAFEAH